MGHFHGIVRFGSHADRAVCGKRGLVKAMKDLRLSAILVAKELTVVTNAIFIELVDLK